MPSPANKSAPISTGLHPASANKKKDKTPRNSPSNVHAGGRTPRANTNTALPFVAPPDPKAFTRKARKTVNIKGNRGKGQSKSGAGGIVVDGDDKEEQEDGSGAGTGSSEEYDDTPELGSAPKAEVKMDELVRAAEERAANGPLASVSHPFLSPHLPPPAVSLSVCCSQTDHFDRSGKNLRRVRADHQPGLQAHALRSPARARARRAQGLARELNGIHGRE
jgi:hypothetical protein